MDFSNAAPLGARHALPAPAPDRRVHPVSPVEEQSASSGAGTDARDHPEQDLHGALSRDLRALRREVEDGTQWAGPAPAFDVSLLEMDSDLRQVLARMEADRSRTRDAEALQVAPPRAGREGDNGVTASAPPDDLAQDIRRASPEPAKSGADASGAFPSPGPRPISG
ncbi:hypothetical protein KJP29_16220 [Maritimibacter sp. DP1N21-5]|nr:hypothetical protein [Maritimibacter sp. DP1N21-5]